MSATKVNSTSKKRIILNKKDWIKAIKKIDGSWRYRKQHNLFWLDCLKNNNLIFSINVKATFKSDFQDFITNFEKLENIPKEVDYLNLKDGYISEHTENILENKISYRKIDKPYQYDGSVFIDSNVLDKVYPFTTIDNTRPACQNVYFSVDNNKVVVGATDGQKLRLITEYQKTPIDNKTSFIIPKKDINKIRAKAKEKIYLYWNSNCTPLNWLIQSFPYQWSNISSSYKYPPIESFTNINLSTSIKLSSKKLKEALQLLLPYLDSTLYLVELKLYNNKLEMRPGLYSRHTHFYYSSFIPILEVDTSFNGISFNGKHILELLKKENNLEQITFYLSNNKKQVYTTTSYFQQDLIIFQNYYEH
jgi:hypothetical protein